MTALQNRLYKAIFDAELNFHDTATAITSDDAGQVGGVDKIVDLVGTGFTKGIMRINVSDINIADGDENYKLRIQGSNTSDFSSGVVNLAVLEIGHASTLGTATENSTAGTYYVAFANELAGTGYQYARIILDGAGTSFSITYEAYAVPL